MPCSFADPRPGGRFRYGQGLQAFPSIAGLIAASKIAVFLSVGATHCKSSSKSDFSGGLSVECVVKHRHHQQGQQGGRRPGRRW